MNIRYLFANERYLSANERYQNQYTTDNSHIIRYRDTRNELPNKTDTRYKYLRH